MIWFTSDEHYGHKNIIDFCKRPFGSVAEQTEGLIARHNEVVKKGDLVYHVGDMFWRTLSLADALNIRYRLNGQHYFVWGNHDELLEDNEILRQSFIWTKDLAYLPAVDPFPKIVLCHYAMHVWRNSHKGAWQLFGHTHANLPETNTLNLDVGVDAWNYYPASIEQVAERMQKKIDLGHGDPMLPGIAKQKWNKTD